MGTKIQLREGFDSAGKTCDSEDWYVQSAYTIPAVGTKIGDSYCEVKTWW